MIPGIFETAKETGICLVTEVLLNVSLDLLRTVLQGVMTA